MADEDSIMRLGFLKILAGLFVSLSIVALVAVFGTQFSPNGWYQGLAKPSWTPPGWIFGPVWTFLYASMGVAAWLVWCDLKIRVSILALGVYIFQLFFNGLWSWLFFGLHRIGPALIDLTFLWILVGLSSILFWTVRRTAGILMFPYFAWTTFALFLNFAIWILNV